jgi:hypothetical protein
MNWEMTIGIIWAGALIWCLYEGITSPVYDSEGNLINRKTKK